MVLDAISEKFSSYIDPTKGTISGRTIQQNIRDFVDKFVASVSEDRIKIVVKMDESARDLMTSLITDKIKTVSNPVELEKFFKAYIDTVGLKYTGLEKIFNLMRDIARGIQGESNPARVDSFLSKISILTRVFNESVEKVIGYRAAQMSQAMLKDAKFEQVRLDITQIQPAETMGLEELGIAGPVSIRLGNVDMATLEGARRLLEIIQTKLTPQQLALFIDELTTGKITIETFLRLAKEEELKKKHKTKNKLLARVLEEAIEEIKKGGGEKKQE
jgi:hypothetical protein